MGIWLLLALLGCDRPTADQYVYDRIDQLEEMAPPAEQTDALGIVEQDGE